MKVAGNLTCDVAIIGGGSAGIAAGVSAAKGGLKVILVEQHGCCGGMSVMSSIHVLDGVMADHDDRELAVGGVALDLIERLRKIGGIGCPDNPPECLSVDPEALKLVADQMLVEAGVRLLYHTRLVDVETQGARIVAALLHNKGGFYRLCADYYIDATGDGDLCAWGGANYEVSKTLQPMTLHFRVHVPKGRKTWKELELDCSMVLAVAHKSGRLKKYGGPWIIRVSNNEVSLNCTRLYGNGLNPDDVTAAEIEGRKNAWRIWNILKENVPDFQDSYILSSGPVVMVRETRRILGEYTLSADDILNGTRFPDPVGLGAWPMDIHPGNGDVGYHPHKENTPHPYQIPYRCLVPKDLENVLVAGRSISATREAHGSSRVQGTAMMTGQAAGLACTVARKAKCTLKNIPYPMLEQELLRTGAILDPDQLLPRPEGWELVRRPVCTNGDSAHKPFPEAKSVQVAPKSVAPSVDAVVVGGARQ